MLFGLVTAFHILVCLVLIGVVLLQTGKRADLAGAFGGGGSQTAFGTRGAATLLSKTTTICAVLFMLTSISLSVLSYKSSGGSDRSVLDSVEAPATTAPDLSIDPASIPATGADDEAVPLEAPAEAPVEPPAEGEDASEDGASDDSE